MPRVFMIYTDISFNIRVCVVGAKTEEDKPINYLFTYLYVVLIPSYSRRGITGYCGARELQNRSRDDVSPRIVAGDF